MAGPGGPARADSRLPRLLTRIPLPAVKGRLDHLSIDPEAQRVFVAANANGTVEVVDILSGKRAGIIRGIRGPLGVAFLPAGKRVFVTGEGGQCAIFDAGASTGTFLKTDSLALPGGADNVRFDLHERRLYVTSGARGIEVVDADSLRRLSTLDLVPDAESFQLARRDPLLYANQPDRSRIALLNRVTGDTLPSWPVARGSGNFALALDERHHRLFCGCRHPARIVVYDMRTAAAIDSMPIGGDVDDLWYDQVQGRIFASCGSGALWVYDELRTGQYRLAGFIPTGPGARTSLFVPALSRIFVAVPARAGKPAALLVFGTS